MKVNSGLPYKERIVPHVRGKPLIRGKPSVRREPSIRGKPRWRGQIRIRGDDPGRTELMMRNEMQYFTS